MKNKYERLTKQERKAAIKEYASISPKNKQFISSTKKMFVIGIIGIIYSVLSITADFLLQFTSVFNYIIDSIVLIFSVFLIVNSRRFMNITINKYLIDKSYEEKEKAAKKEAKKENKKDKKTTTKKVVKKNSKKKIGE